jgi:hypothetical protein
MLTGALASSYYGRPRTTLDIDVVVAATRNDLTILVETLKTAGLATEEQMLATAWQSPYRIATVEDKSSPHTLDIIFIDGPLERRAGSVLGLPSFYQTPESLILAKLRMIKATQNPERAATDREDIKAILKNTRVDLEDLRKRAQAEGTSEILEDLIRE